MGHERIYVAGKKQEQPLRDCNVRELSDRILNNDSILDRFNDTMSKQAEINISST